MDIEDMDIGNTILGINRNHSRGYLNKIDRIYGFYVVKNYYF